MLPKRSHHKLIVKTIIVLVLLAIGYWVWNNLDGGDMLLLIPGLIFLSVGFFVIFLIMRPNPDLNINIPDVIPSEGVEIPIKGMATIIGSFVLGKLWIFEDHLEFSGALKTTKIYYSDIKNVDLKQAGPLESLCVSTSLSGLLGTIWFMFPNIKIIISLLSFFKQKNVVLTDATVTFLSQNTTNNT